MTEPKQPDDHPSLEQNPTMPPHAPNGVPAGTVDAEPTGRPTSEREETEAAASPEKHGPD